jgi:hypothetical protein
MLCLQRMSDGKSTWTCGKFILFMLGYHTTPRDHTVSTERPTIAIDINGGCQNQGITRAHGVVAGLVLFLTTARSSHMQFPVLASGQLHKIVGSLFAGNGLVVQPLHENQSNIKLALAALSISPSF